MDLSECRGLCPSCLKAAGTAEICPFCGNPRRLDNAPRLLAVGSALGGRYYVGRAVAHSAQSVSYIGLDLIGNRRVIVREFFPEKKAARLADRYTVGYDPSRVPGDVYHEEKTRFAERTGKLALFRRYKGIVAFLDRFEENGTVYGVSEYPDGAPLSVIFEQRDAPFSPEELLSLMEPVFMAVDAFNTEWVVHGGISPERIVVTDEGARLLDLSDGSPLAANQVSHSGYIAPELFSATGEPGPWTDLYALAAVFYKGITGLAPLPAKMRTGMDPLKLPSSLNPRIGVLTESALLKGLSMNPKERYKHASRFYDDLVYAALNWQ